jgi:hypothetical protein
LGMPWNVITRLFQGYWWWKLLLFHQHCIKLAFALDDDECSTDSNGGSTNWWSSSTKLHNLRTELEWENPKRRWVHRWSNYVSFLSIFRFFFFMNIHLS